MGDLQEKLDGFQNQIKATYTEIMGFLEDNYCWKCPMRPTSQQSRCREVHAGRLLNISVEEGVIHQLNDSNIPTLEVESIILKMVKKKIIKQGGKQRETIISFKVQSEQNQDLLDKCLMVKVNPRKVKIGEKILIPAEPSEYPILGSVALVSGFPFMIVAVKRTFHEGNFWYVEVENEKILPLESVFGVLVKVFNDKMLMI